MRKKNPVNRVEAFEAALKQKNTTQYLLRLYVAGNTSRSQLAIENIQEFCEEHLKGRYRLEVIDVYQQPALAQGEQIIATPTLIKYLPTPLRKLIGDFSKDEKLLVGLNLFPLEDMKPQDR